MPRPMEKKDWMQTIVDVGSADGVWYESVSVDGGHFQLSVPDSGIYRVILVKVGNGPSAKRPHQMKSAHDYIGYCRGNYNGHTTTAEIMKELREGEE